MLFRNYTFTIITLIFGLMLTSISYSQNYDEASIKKAIFKIRASDCQLDSNDRALTGFVLQEGMLTALHGVVGCNNIRAINDDGTVYRDLSIIKADLKNDLALLQSSRLTTDIDSQNQAKLTTSNNLFGNISVIGYPLDLDEAIDSQGLRIRNKTALTNLIPPLEKEAFKDCISPQLDAEVLSIQGTLRPGESGAPILNEQGQVIGLGMGGIAGGSTEIVWASIIEKRDLDDANTLKSKLDLRAQQTCLTNRFAEERRGVEKLTQEKERLERVLDRLLNQLDQLENKNLELDRKNQHIAELENTLEDLKNIKSTQQETFDIVTTEKIQEAEVILETYTQELLSQLQSTEKKQSWKSITAGGIHTCGISDTNQAYCWGNGTDGILGTNSTINQAAPTLVINPSGVTSWKTLIVERYHTCGIANNNQVYCWGLGKPFILLGNNTTSSKSVPTKVVNPPEITGWEKLFASTFNTCGIANNNKLYCWGGGGGALATPSLIPKSIINPQGVDSWKQLKLSEFHICGLASNNQVYCWGNGERGKLGNNSVRNRNRPAQISNPSGVTSWKLIDTWIWTTCGIADNDQAYCWGQGNNGELGNGTDKNQQVPTLVKNPLGVNGWKSIRLGTNHTCGMTLNNQIYCWGSGNGGANGLTSQTNIPNLIQNPSEVTQWDSLHIKGLTNCGIALTDQVFCWGAGGSGQLGIGSTFSYAVPQIINTPKEVNGWKDLTLNGAFCALSDDNKGYCWGLGVHGQLGNGSFENKTTPTLVRFPQK